MDTFDFLAPWINHLTPVLTLSTSPEGCSAFGIVPRVHGIKLKPFDEVPGKAWGGEDIAPIVDGFPAVRCAMEVVALALRVEPRVWTLLRGRAGATLVDEATFSIENLETGIEIAFKQNDYLASSVIYAFFTRSVSPELSCEYETAKRKLRTLDRMGRLADYRIPLTITAMLVPNKSMTDAYVKRLVDSYKLLFRVGSSENSEVATTTTPTLFRPARVSLQVAAWNLSCIQELMSRNVAIDRVVNDEINYRQGDFVKTIELLRDGGSRVLTVETTLNGDPSIESLFQALHAGGRCIQSLVLTVKDKCDGALLGRVLAASRVACPALRRLAIHCPKTLMPKHVKALEVTMALAMQGRCLEAKLREPLDSLEEGSVVPVFPCNDTALSFVVLPENRLRQVNSSDLEIVERDSLDDSDAPRLTELRLDLTTYNESARRLVAFVVACLPQQLQALALTVRSYSMPSSYYWNHSHSDAEGGPPLDDDAVASILAAAPQLHTLELCLPSLMPLDELLTAYADGRCSVRALTLPNASATVTLALLGALADATTRVFACVEELSLICPEDRAERNAWVGAVEAVLRLNDRLKYLKLTRCTGAVETTLKAATRASLRSPLRLALASAVRRYGAQSTGSAMGRLDAVVLSRISAFAEAARRCRLELGW